MMKGAKEISSAIKKIFVTFVIVLSQLSNYGQARPDLSSFKDRLQPVDESSFFKTEGYYNWCPSILKTKNGVYHLFYSRWKKEYGFGGWLTHSEIAHAVSNKPTGPWKLVGTVLSGAGSGHWDAITAHNPRIEYFDGKYYLYYIATNTGNKAFSEKDRTEWAKASNANPNRNALRNNQRVGVAVAGHINGPYQRMDHPIIEPSGPITHITTNPAIVQGKDKRYYLIVKGDKPGNTKFIRNQAIAVSTSPVGPFEMQPKPVIDYLDTEDMSTWYDKKRDYYYGIFHSTEGFIGLVSSPDGINWNKAHDFVVMPKQLKMKNGEVRKYDSMERPFIFVSDNEPKVLSLALKKGDDSFLVFIPIKPASKNK